MNQFIVSFARCAVYNDSMRGQLKEGNKAPDFSVKDVTGRTIKLSNYEGRVVLVVFLRYAGCPWCNLAIHRLTVEYPLLQKSGCEVIAFVQSDSEKIKKNIYERHAKKPPFPIIADADMSIYDKYRIQSSVAALAKSITKIPSWVHAVKDHGFKQTELDGKFFLVPASFLIDGSKRTILKAKYASSFYEHETFTDIYERLTFTG